MSSKNRSHGIGVGGEALFSPTDRTEQGINNYLNNFSGGDASKTDWRTNIVWGAVIFVALVVWIGSRTA